MSDPQYRCLSDATSRAWLVSLRTTLKPILAGNYLSFLTDHSVEHSDRLCELVDRLIEPMTVSEKLRDPEAFVLYAACYLHDVGLQHQRAGETQVVAGVLGQAEYRGRKWEDLSDTTRQLIVREKHHAISSEMIQQSIDAAQPTVLGIQIPQDWNPGQIMALSLAHNLDATSNEYSNATQEGGGFRMSLLSALLRLADILDESRRRSHLYLERTRELGLEARMHWWRHYYVAEVEINPLTRQIILWFDFPAERRSQYREMIPPLQVPLLEDEIDRHSATLARHNLLYHFRTAEINPLQSVARVMDAELEQYILQKLAAKTREQAERDRLMLLNQINVARPTVERDLNNLRSCANTTTADEQLSGFLRLAQHLWNLGGHRAAWSTLWHEYDRLKVSVTLGIQFNVAVELSNMMTEDGDTDLAARILHDLRDKAQSLSALDLRYRFLVSLGRAYMNRCAYEQAVATLSSASQIAPDDRSRALIEAELSEARLLICDFHQLESSMNERKNDD